MYACLATRLHIVSRPTSRTATHLPLGRPQVLRMHVLENVRLRIEAGHIDYVNEIRNCTTLFLGFPSLNSLLGQPSESALAAAEAEVRVVAGGGSI